MQPGWVGWPEDTWASHGGQWVYQGSSEGERCVLRKSDRLLLWEVFFPGVGRDRLVDVYLFVFVPTIPGIPGFFLTLFLMTFSLAWEPWPAISPSSLCLSTQSFHPHTSRRLKMESYGCSLEGCCSLCRVTSSNDSLLLPTLTVIIYQLHGPQFYNSTALKRSF